MTIGDTLLSEDGIDSVLEQQMCVVIKDGEETDYDYSLDLPADLFEAHKKELYSGTLLVSVDGAFIENNEIFLTVDAEFKVVDADAEHMRHLTLSQPATGNRGIYVVRVCTTDSCPIPSLGDIKNRISTTTGPSIRNQYAACSFNQLTFYLEDAIDLTIDRSVGSFNGNSVDLMYYAEAYLREQTGVTSVKELGDHLVYVLPPGTGNWLGYAPMNHFRVVTNNEWGLSMSVVMHELGHNLGLPHSGQGSEVYGDETGLMGYSYFSQTWPRKCFNGVKNWELNWYANNNVSIEPGTPQMVNLAPFVDYPKAAPTDAVVLNLGDVYYIQYNRKKDFNVETGEMADKVTVTEDVAGGSRLRQGLSVGDTFSVANWKGTGQTLYVKVCSSSTGTSSTPDAMQLSIGLGSTLCPNVSNNIATPPKKCRKKRKRCRRGRQCCSGKCRRRRCK
jgi:hypothetical protein